VKKIDYTKDTAPDTGAKKDFKYVYGPLKAVNTSLTNEEVTSFFNINRPSYFPLKNVQVRIAKSPTLMVNPALKQYSLSLQPTTAASSDIPLEISFMITRDFVLNDLLGGNVSQSEIEEALKSVGFGVIMPPEINFYAKMSGSIKNNRTVNLKIYSASIMGISIPADVLQSNDVSNMVSEIINYLLDNYKTESGATFTSIKTEAGTIRIEGMVPSSVTRTPIK